MCDGEETNELCGKKYVSVFSLFFKTSCRQNTLSANSPFGKMSFGKISFGKMSFCKMSGHRIVQTLINPVIEWCFMVVGINVSYPQCMGKLSAAKRSLVCIYCPTSLYIIPRQGRVLSSLFLVFQNNFEEITDYSLSISMKQYLTRALPLLTITS